MWFVRQNTDDIYCIFPGREAEAREWVSSRLSVGDVFIDVGANIGYYTVICSTLVGNQGRVISFEPYPRTFDMLSLNCKLNQLSNVTLEPRAAWSEACVKPLYFPKDYYTISSLFSDHIWESFPLARETIEIETTTLDSSCSQYASIKLIKIDAEGSELQVLLGAENTLERTKYILFECTRNFDEIHDFLENRGFKVSKLDNIDNVVATKEEIS
ncbi:MAG: FkbM family methyltransferase [Halobacteriota archaeon]